MKDTAIYNAAVKVMPATCDVEHYLEILFREKEGTWFAPSNKSDESYTVCKELSMCRLIAERKIPKWNNGSFRGYHVEFMYVKNMEIDAHD